MSEIRCEAIKDSQQRLVVQGTVLRKRSLGRLLSFITIQLSRIEPDSNSEADLAIVKFERIPLFNGLKPGAVVRVEAIPEDLQTLVAVLGPPTSESAQDSEPKRVERILRLEALDELVVLEAPPDQPHRSEAHARQDAPPPFAGPRGRAGLCRSWARAAVAGAGEVAPGCTTKDCPFRHAFSGSEEELVRRQAEEAEEARCVFCREGRHTFRPVYSQWIGISASMQAATRLVCALWRALDSCSR
jgi:hypothetical protein